MKKMLCLLWLLALMPSCAHATTPMAIAPLYQAAYPQPLFLWEGEEKSVASSGCGAVCMAMVLQYYFPDKEATDPVSLLTHCYENGDYQGNGLSLNTLANVLDSYGLTCKIVDMDRKLLTRALKRNRLIIAYMDAGLFSSGGHYILLYGNDRGIGAWVIDPNSPERSEKTYSFDDLFYNAGSEHPFLVCFMPEPQEK